LRRTLPVAKFGTEFEPTKDLEAVSKTAKQSAAASEMTIHSH
jgi:hypothetical protein